MTAVLTVQDLHKRFGDRRVLAGASFVVDERDRIGLIGANGAGKSTLLKMIVAGAAGGGVTARDAAERDAITPDSGVITWRRDLTLEYVPQEPILDPEATVGATLARPGVELHQVRTVAAALDLPPEDAVLGRLSGGELRRVALARALLGTPDVLALDEPTNHLDADTVAWLEDRLGSFPGAVIVVTHDRYFLDRVATRILEVDRGQVFGYDGDYTYFLEKQAERLSIESTHEHERAMFVRRELDWIRRAPPARTVKSKARVDRFDAAVERAPGVDERPPRRMALTLPAGPRLGSTILETRALTKRIGDRTLFSDLTMTMKPRDRIGIVGKNGAGKTTLIRTLLGELPPDGGTVTLGVNTRPAYLEQARTDLDDDRTVIEEVAGGYDHVELESGRTHVRTFLRQLGFADATADAKVGKLSGGERNRVMLARLLRRGGNLLVLDEPTNDLDLITLATLEDGLLDFPGCALIVSHDRWFLDRVATGILAFDEFGVTFYEGTYSSYEAKRLARRAEAKRPAPAAAKVAATSKAERPRKRTFKEQQELTAMEATILTAEARVGELEAALSDPALFRDRPLEVAGLNAALEAARAEVERLYARWAELDAIPPA
ncbi:MAG: ATP-binding cassette domain-containing protein [Myxococcales bacterium]|nr:ATP-binding cassette domain-containing protein [Myxococcales bacterium]